MSFKNGQNSNFQTKLTVKSAFFSSYHIKFLLKNSDTMFINMYLTNLSFKKLCGQYILFAIPRSSNIRFYNLRISCYETIVQKWHLKDRSAYFRTFWNSNIGRTLSFMTTINFLDPYLKVSCLNYLDPKSFCDELTF